MTNAVVTWNTVYMEAALAQLRTEGVLAGDLDLSHLSPALYGHLNPSPSDDPERWILHRCYRNPTMGS